MVDDSNDNAKHIAALRAGDPQAYRAVYDYFATPIFAFLLRLSRRRALAEELSQNVWLKLARSAPRLAPDTRLNAWLFTVARNEYRSYRRWIVVDTDRLRTLQFAMLEPRAQTPESATESRMELARTGTALDALPPADREVILLCAESELDDDAIAGVLNLTHEALRQRKSRARRRLKAFLEKERT